MEKLIVILGPTATGKSALAVEIARAVGGEIISADSRQVYTGLNLGTGKVTKKEMLGVPHHLLDVANAQKQFSVAEYAKLAQKKIAEIRTRGNVPIICGGTGFYIDTALSDTPLPEVPPNRDLRKMLAPKSAENLFHMLEKLDPARAQSIDKYNKVRLIRAIEIAKALGSVPKLQKNEGQKNILKIGLDMSDDTLKMRIIKRLHERMKQGMLREAKRLHAKGLSWKRMLDLGLEYRSMAQLLTNTIDRAEFDTRLALDIWHYAKRQRTWFKRDSDIIWLDPTKKQSSKKALGLAKKFLAKK
jgi:tRNA dimethylallyltransferase